MNVALPIYVEERKREGESPHYIAQDHALQLIRIHEVQTSPDFLQLFLARCDLRRSKRQEARLLLGLGLLGLHIQLDGAEPCPPRQCRERNVILFVQHSTQPSRDFPMNIGRSSSFGMSTDFQIKR